MKTSPISVLKEAIVILLPRRAIVCAILMAGATYIKIVRAPHQGTTIETIVYAMLFAAIGGYTIGLMHYLLAHDLPRWRNLHE